MPKNEVRGLLGFRRIGRDSSNPRFLVDEASPSYEYGERVREGEDSEDEGEDY